MTPDFDELVGAELDPAERARLERVHELLIAAGPPPQLAAPAPVPVPLRSRRRRRGAVLAIAAALAVGGFAVGAALVGGTEGRNVDFEVAMSGVGANAGASATIDVFELDAAGNWPMEVHVTDLAPAPRGRPYELWLTRNGERVGYCGSFLTEPDGSADVPMNAPFKLADAGWVIVEAGSETPILTT